MDVEVNEVSIGGFTGGVKMGGMKFELYKDVNGNFRWRFLTSGGQIIAIAARGYESREVAEASITSASRYLQGYDFTAGRSPAQAYPPILRLPN